MWTREGLKNYAKEFLKKHYWKAFLVCLIFTILSGEGSNSSGNNNERRNINIGPKWSYDQSIPFEDNGVIYNIGNKGIRNKIGILGFFPALFFGSTIFTFALILALISLFVGPLITVGKNRFFLNGFKGDVNVATVFSAFNREEFWGIFTCMLITKIKNFLWFLLLVFPGIAKSYEYSMVPYLLASNSNLTSSEAIKISRDLTMGHKWEMFVLDLSFIGWYLLGILSFGIGTFFVTPYYQATMARLYNVLSGNDDGPNKEFDIIYE